MLINYICHIGMNVTYSCLLSQILKLSEYLSHIYCEVLLVTSIKLTTDTAMFSYHRIEHLRRNFDNVLFLMVFLNSVS